MPFVIGFLYPVSGPVDPGWGVGAPPGGGGAPGVPTHPIYTPPGIWPGPTPTPPIYYPPGGPGGPPPGAPSHPIYQPPQIWPTPPPPVDPGYGLPIGGHPSHPIYNPPVGIWPSPPSPGHPSHPIAGMPPVLPAHPIVLPPAPGTPEHPIVLPDPPPGVPTHPITEQIALVLVWTPAAGWHYELVKNEPDATPK